jgi:hypothetical protein
MFLISTIVINMNVSSSYIRTDYDPLVDVEVTVEIQRIRSFEKFDRQLLFKEEIDRNSEPDFFIKVLINEKEFESDVWYNTKYLYDINWKATLDVPDEEEIVNIKIQLWDYHDDGQFKDRLCDISGDSGKDSDSYDVEIQYSIKTGHWTGDDFLDHDISNSDPSGYGRLCGCDDGTIYVKDRDCELWFNIYQNDYDNDGIPYWAEENLYGSDPTIMDYGDSDGDGIPLQWEWKWGFNPYIPEEHSTLDHDADSLTNIEEFLTSEWFSDPFRKDVFVELDIMDNGPNGEKCEFPQGSKELINTAFNRQNIVFHLDDGIMGGHDIIPFDEKIEDYEELISIYNNYFLHGNQNTWRRGVFHYGVVVYSIEGPAGFIFRANAYQITCKGHERKSTSIWLNRDEVFASAYMHELGHTLQVGGRHIPGHDRDSMFPYQLGWWLNRPYKSCMNYGYMYTMVDYSDGSRPSPDIDDWSNLDFDHFEREWHQ